MPAPLVFGLPTALSAAKAAGSFGASALVYEALKNSPSAIDFLGNFVESGNQIRGRSGAKRAANRERQTIASLPADYKETELAAGAAAEAFRPGAGFPGQQVAPISQVSPQDRAYAKERARVEAMIKANPDMQKQDIAAARAKVRDQGLTEWAKANPELAKNVRPGQVGYEIARDVAYPMPSSLADPSIPDLGYNINLQYDPGLGRTISNTDVKPSVVDTSTQLPPSAEQTYMDPDFYQLQGYQQGQGAAASQTEGPKIANLGSAIRRELYPQFDGTTSFSPQMNEMFPDRSTQSLENVVQEKGVQLPNSMITADAQNELLSGSTDNRMYQYNKQAAEVDKLLKLIADRQLLK